VGKEKTDQTNAQPHPDSGLTDKKLWDQGAAVISAKEISNAT
jgi:hypothetical protein